MNIYLIYLRQFSGLTVNQASHHIGVCHNRYLDLENGNDVVSSEEAKLLGDLYGVKSHYVEQSSYQVYLLRKFAEQCLRFENHIYDLEQNIRSFTGKRKKKK
jgi:hypothetical protein